MLSKPIADIAKTFIKDGMKLDDAVLAAFRLMDEAPTPEVSKVLARDAKFNPGTDDTFMHKVPPEEIAQVLRNAEGNVRDSQRLVTEWLPSNVPSEIRRGYRQEATNPSKLSDWSDSVYGSENYTMPSVASLQEFNVDPVDALYIGNSLVDDAQTVREAAARNYALKQLGLL